MAAAVAAGPDNRRSSQWAQQYPPLLAIIVAALIALVVMPSSLNLPQSNPSTTLEYAPVPPEDDTPPPPSGNVSTLGLAETGGLESGGAPGGTEGGPGGLDEGPPPDIPEAEDLLGGGGKTPRTKNCVGNPPKQTDDPLAPPCVADFQGDNFGATYQGVNKEEVRILFYIQGFTNYVNTCQDPGRVTPDNEYFDLAEPADPEEHCVLRVLRTWMQYFNDRYQTYNRFVHFYVYFSGEGDSPELRRADAADNYNRIKPFAVISTANSHDDAYLETMAKRGVLNFDSALGRDAAFFQKFPKLIWGYYPTQEISVKQYVSYICKKVGPDRPVSFSGNPGDLGKERVYGLWSTSDAGHPELQRTAALVESSLKEECGITFKVKREFPVAGYVKSTRYSNRYATEAVADFAGQGVTTIIWPGGLETNLSGAGSTANYRPELVVLGDRVIETDTSGTFQDGSFWQNARLVTNIVREPPIREQQCYTSYREADPESDFGEISATACAYYPGIRQLFIGIQVAGPRLTPTSIDKGFHAIPKVRSTNPFIPACFYDPGDYTCVKDAIVERWNPAQDDGCYQLTEGGLRYFAEIWPEGNPQDQEKPDDPCNEYDDSFLIDNGTPDDPTTF